MSTSIEKNTAFMTMASVGQKIISFVYFRRKIWNSGATGAVILVLFALRELDFQKKFSSVSITRTKFYFSPDISLFVKIIGGAIVLFILITLVLFVRRNAGVFFLQSSGILVFRVCNASLDRYQESRCA